MGELYDFRAMLESTPTTRRKPGEKRSFPGFSYSFLCVDKLIG
ncbi:hypothetical protein [Fodinibius salicampi]|nr:hypothetical protein [Fodinibius salicampi]